MDIALLTPRFWPEVRRGTERFVHELAAGLLTAGHSPRVITSHQRRLGPGTEEGVPVLRVPRVPERRLERRLYEPYLGHRPFTRAALHATRPDVAHAFALPDMMAALDWAGATGRPTIFTHMGVPNHEDLVARRKRIPFMERTTKQATFVVALSEFAREAFKEWLFHDARVIYPGVDLSRFALGSDRSADPTVVCSAAPWEPRKRVSLLIQAWPEVRAAHPGARLLLDARGRDWFKPREGVEFVDMDDSAELARLNGQAWAAALPSSHEAFGLVLVEALATGTPVVGSVGGAFGEVVDRPEIGRLFDGTPEDLAVRLLECFDLARDPGTRAACRERAEAFSSARTTAAYEALYAEALG